MGPLGILFSIKMLIHSLLDFVINISSSKNLNIFITDINKINGTFKIKKSFEEEIEVYYVIIES